MTYKLFSFEDIDPNSKIVFLDDDGPSFFYHKLWRLETDIENNISEILRLHNIRFSSFTNRDKTRWIYDFAFEEGYNIAKFLI